MKNPISLRLLLCLLFCGSMMTATFAQIDMPQPSPSSVLTQKVGVTEIKLDYSRPSMKGRKVFGELVAFGELWRTGANQATKFTTTDSITFMGQGLAKGTYSVFTIPTKDSWTVIFNKDASAGTAAYKTDKDALRLTVKPMMLPMNIETFTFNIGNITTNSATLEMMWENTLIVLPFTSDVDSKINAQIKSVLDGPNEGTYASMARYYLESGKDLKLAKEWIGKAIEKNPTAYWHLRQKSLIEAKLKEYKAATMTAQASLDLAKKEGNMDYVRMNEKSIAEWAKMK
jgi:hypothetical protein